MSDHRAIWTTDDEIEYLRDLMLRRGLDAIKRYAAVMHMRSDWGQINPDRVLDEVRQMLDAATVMEWIDRLAAKGVVQ